LLLAALDVLADLHIAPMLVSLTSLLNFGPLPALWVESSVRFHLLPAMLYDGSDKKGDVYNILWVLVFGFATLNILGLVAKRFEPERSRLSLGETLAIMVVVVSIVLLGWEMLNLFKIFPIKLQRHG
jgi:hypothetical protein